MPTPIQVLQADISAREKAVRLLIGEEAALRSKTAKAQAIIKLELARLHALTHPAPAVASRFADVSNNQPNIDVAKVRTQGAIVRAHETLFTKVTEGVTFVDHLGLIRLREMRKQQFPTVGVYSYLHPSFSGGEQARFLFDQLDRAGIKLGPNDIVAADLETADGRDGATVRVCAHNFAIEARRHHPGPLWLYGGGPFLKSYGVTLAGYDAHWLAAYVNDPKGFEIYGAPRTKAWQYTNGTFGPKPHACPGIGACDMSIILR